MSLSLPSIGLAVPQMPLAQGPGATTHAPPPSPMPHKHDRLETITRLLHGSEEKVYLICAFELDCGGVDGSPILPPWAYGCVMKCLCLLVNKLLNSREHIS